MWRRFGLGGVEKVWPWAWSGEGLLLFWRLRPGQPLSHATLGFHFPFKMTFSANSVIFRRSGKSLSLNRLDFPVGLRSGCSNTHVKKHQYYIMPFLSAVIIFICLEYTETLVVY